MRKEEYTVGSYVHVVNRGYRKMPIVRDKTDREHFEKILYYLNNTYSLPVNWKQLLKKSNLYDNFKFLSEWKERQPLVKILAYTLMPNHIHLLLKEIIENGVANFMRKISNSMTANFNGRHDEIGGIFQNSYKSKTIETDEYLKGCAAYIMVKNTFELIPKTRFLTNEQMLEKASEFEFSSLPEYLGKRNLPIIEKDILGQLFDTPQDFRSFALGYMENREFDDKRFNL